MLHMSLWLYTHVSSVCFKRFFNFRRMLQVFHPYVSKVDLAEHMCNGANGLLQPPVAAGGAAVGHRVGP
jgi:hypothetical protein